MTVLVTGAAGSVGRHVIDRLLAAGARVRALTRTPDTAGLPADVEVVRGDLTRPETLRAALSGVDRAYLFPLPETAREFVGLAEAAGLQRIVVLSSSSVLDETGGNHSGVYHRTVERAVEASRLDWTFVRPDEFAGNILWKWGHSIRTEGLVRAPYPGAARALIHEADVAAVAAAALLEDGHAGRAYELTGPESLTQSEQVRAIGEALGRQLRFEEVTPEQGREEMSRFMPEPVVDMVLAYLARSVGRPATVLPTVEKITGRPGRPFAQWAADHAADFRR